VILQEISLQFVAATKEHFAEIAALVKSPEELYLVYPSGHYPWDSLQLRQLAHMRSDLTVALVDGEVAAFANLYDVIPNQSAFIGNLIVSPRYKRMGIGRSLTVHMIEICEKKYRARPHLSVFGFNAPAILLYSSLDFKPYAVEPREDLKGEPVVLFHMRHDGR
jgi:ribosomal protein S18 acetylase RimI-like enzyme